MEEARIGVFVCHCGTNIGGFLDVPALVEYATGLPNVVFSQDGLYSCSEAGLTDIKKAIAEQKLNRVVVASCTPRTHEALFRRTCEEAGLNPYLFEFVNIRDQCSWVHMEERARATGKAKDLIRMGVARARLLEPQEEIAVSVVPAALVIGGGIAGVTCALSLANRGFKVTLVEREKELGGLLKNLHKLYPTQEDASQFIESKIEEVEKNRNIEVLTSAKVGEVKGFIGNYDVKVRQGGKDIPFRVGVIVVATGAQEFKPIGMHGYDGVNVVTQLELERMLKEGRFNAVNVVMIQCVGPEEGNRNYCSGICCITALKNAIMILETNPEAQVFILYRDMQTYGTSHEELYRKAREKGIIFIEYSPLKPPVVNGGYVNVFDELLGEELQLTHDLIVLSTPMVPDPDTEELARMLKVPLDENGFFLEAHVKLRPLDFATDGVYICGSAHWPSTVSESIAQAYGAASRACTILAKDHIEAEGIVASVDPDRCIVCGNCEAVCEFGAIRVGRGAAEVNPLLCKGCGTCSVECPAMAITMRHFTDDQISSMIDVALEPMSDRDEPKALALFCNWCAYAGADMAGVSRFQYPPTVRIIRVMCTGRVNERHILQAFLSGADGVLIGGCHPGDCHYVSGNLEAEARVKRVRRLLGEAGLEADRLRLEWVSAGEGRKLADVMKDFSAHLKKMGPSPLRNVVQSRHEPERAPFGEP